MKKLCCLILILCLLVGTVFASGNVNILPAPLLENGDGLETLWFGLEIDEETSDVQAVLQLKNPTSEEISTPFCLPQDELAAAGDTLACFLDGRETPLPDQITVPAGGYRTVEYSYRTATPLRDARVISFDLHRLVFTEGAKIGKFSFALHLCEEDVPLVTDIKPVNYTYEDQTVSVVLYDFAPSRLLDRVYIAKDTWKDLSSSREFEPNEEQRYFLENYRDWFKNGMPIGTENYVSYDYNVMRGRDPNDWETFYEGGYYDLWEHTYAFVHAAEYLYEKARREAAGITEVDTTTLGLDPYMPLLLAECFCSDAQREAFRTVACVEFADNPSLEGHELYSKKTIEQGWDEEVGCYQVTEDIRITQQQALQATISMTHMSGGLPLQSHVALLPGSLSATPEEIAAFVDVIGAVYYIRQMLYDGTVTPYPSITETYPTYDDDGNEIGEHEVSLPFSVVIGYCGEENELIALAATELSAMDWHADYQVMPVSDPVLERLDIPAVILYRGYVKAEDGREFVEFTFGHYLEYYNSISRYENVAATERGQELLSAASSRREETRSRVDAEIADGLSAANAEPPDVPETEPNAEEETAKPLSPLFFLLPAIALIAAVTVLLILKKKGTKHE